MTTYGATNDGKVVKLTTFCFQCDTLSDEFLLCILMEYVLAEFIKFIENETKK